MEADNFMDKGTVSDFDLISGRDIYVEGVGTIHQPLLSEIKSIGVEKYYCYLSLILIDMDHLTALFHIPKDLVADEITPFELFSMSSDTMGILISALQFFFVEKLSFSEKHRSILLITDNLNVVKIGHIDKNNFSYIRSIILNISGIEEEKEEKPVVKSAKALEIEARLKKGRQKMEEARRRAEAGRNELWNIIGAVAAGSDTYNLINIWELTIPQLYDQFARINSRFYLDMMTTRWCIWGEEKFEQSPWYSVPSK